jgi:hypothetical protein
MKTFISLIFCIMIGASFAQQSNVIILKSGESIPIKGSLKQYGMQYTYKNSKGKYKTLSAAKINFLHYDGITMMSLPMRDGGRKLLMRILAISDTHILTSYKEFEDLLHFYVFDRDFKCLESHFDMHPIQSEKQKAENLDNLQNRIVKYFGECEGMIEILRNNVLAMKEAHTGLSYYKCGEPKEIDLTKIP